MIGFWIAAALLSALAAALMLYRAARLARRPEVDPAQGVYRRQLAEIDDLADRGLLAEGERRSARAEAARRLLGAADAARPAPLPPSASKGARLGVVLGAAAAPLVALGLYLALGSPGLPDQPFAQRLAAWRAGDPHRLGAAELAAVLRDIVRARPDDPQARLYLARAEAAAGNLPAAADTLHTAARLAPTDPDVWSILGEVLVEQAQGTETPAAVDAFRRAVVLDPKAALARYHLGRAKIMNGDLPGGLADWRALAAALPAQDAGGLQQQIDATAKAGRLVEPDQAQQQEQAQAQAASPAAAPADQKAFIQSMVDGLAAKLKAAPDDPDGWGRLARAYGVLGESDRQSQAQAEATRLFRDRPEAMKAFNRALAGQSAP